MPDGSKRSPDKIEINQELKAHYKTLIAIRNAYPALREGAFKPILVDDEGDLYGFERSLNNQRIWVVFNNSSDSREVRLDKSKGTEFKEIFGKSVSMQSKLALSLRLPAKSASIWITK
jgi:glycosidase